MLELTPLLVFKAYLVLSVIVFFITIITEKVDIIKNGKNEDAFNTFLFAGFFGVISPLVSLIYFIMLFNGLFNSLAKLIIGFDKNEKN